ncbi:unnamed protein product [Coffea canephora]|uniref:Uncharacterized protein n=1 Tax=Coffea canephora TaxID=49390 RepID=A0A068V934_COFCA|nr:unnamed protein product [Coffea canephora]
MHPSTAGLGLGSSSRRWHGSSSWCHQEGELQPKCQSSISEINTSRWLNLSPMLPLMWLRVSKHLRRYHAYIFPTSYHCPFEAISIYYQIFANPSSSFIFSRGHNNKGAGHLQSL